MFGKIGSLLQVSWACFNSRVVMLTSDVRVIASEIPSDKTPFEGREKGVQWGVKVVVVFVGLAILRICRSSMAFIWRPALLFVFLSIVLISRHRFASYVKVEVG
jgi:hypothetical protein